MDDHNTEITEVSNHVPNNNNEPEHDNIKEQGPQRSNQIRIWNQGGEQIHKEFEYISLQGTIGDTESFSPGKFQNYNLPWNYGDCGNLNLNML